MWLLFVTRAIFLSHQLAWPKDAWLCSMGRLLHFHHNCAACLKMCLKPMMLLPQSLQYYIAYRVAPLIQLQTCSVHYNFTIKAPFLLAVTKQDSWKWRNSKTQQMFERIKRMRETKEIQLEATKVVRALHRHEFKISLRERQVLVRG